VSHYPKADLDKLMLFLNVVGVRIAHPDWEREPYAILIRGVQGTGKNTIMEIFRDLVGVAHYKCSSDIDDYCGAHAEGLPNKVIVVLNEIDLSQSVKNEGKVKGLVSEDTATADPKNIRPYEYRVNAAFFALSNVTCPIKLDVSNSDRRWIVLESNTFCATNWNRNIWNAIRQRFKTPVFLRALRQYVTTQDYPSYDFKKGKAANVKTSAYQNLVQYFVPAEARFVQDYIENESYNPGSMFADAVVDEEGPPFYENTKWDMPVQVNAKKLFDDSKHYYKENSINGGVAEKSMQSFNNKIQTLDTMTKKNTKRGQVSWEFTPREVYEQFVQKGFISEECIDQGLKQALKGMDETPVSGPTMDELGLMR
jgi:phage/plasmid-associated DNA primase